MTRLSGPSDDPPAEPRRLCVIVQLDKASNMQRVAEAVPQIVGIFARLSNNEMEQLCRSNDGQLFGYLIRTRSHPNVVRAAFDQAHSTTNKDAMIVFDVGEGMSGIGFTRAGTWLQRH